MLLLCLETSADRCSVALYEDTRMIGYRSTDEEKAHSRKLALFIDEIFNELDLQPASLDAVAYSEGPGSYTGLRVGLSTAKGIAFSLDIPLIGIPTSHIFLAEARDKRNADLYFTLQDARRMEAYVSTFSGNGQELHSDIPTILDEEWKSGILKEGNKVVICGTGAGKTSDLFSGHENIVILPFQPDARHMGMLAREAFLKKDFKNILLAEPRYVKSPNITSPRSKTL